MTSTKADLPTTEGARDTSGVEPRVMAAWRAWLTALSTDAEAAIAAAMAYEALDGDGRTRWLDALDLDALELDVPRVAVYAPLLAVEDDADRRDRIHAALADGPEPSATQARRAFRGTAPDGDRIAVLVVPVYLEFVQVITCRFRPSEGFAWARRESLMHADQAPRDVTRVDDVSLERTPIDPVVEEIAHAVVAHRRSGRPLPDALHALVDLLAPTYEACD